MIRRAGGVITIAFALPALGCARPAEPARAAAAAVTAPTPIPPPAPVLPTSLCAAPSPACQSRNRRVRFLVRESAPVQLSASPSR
jgi:hypothetical protein